jgi:hypothetical protein
MKTFMSHPCHDSRVPRLALVAPLALLQPPTPPSLQKLPFRVCELIYIACELHETCQKDRESFIPTTLSADTTSPPFVSRPRVQIDRAVPAAAPGFSFHCGSLGSRTIWPGGVLVTVSARATPNLQTTRSPRPAPAVPRARHAAPVALRSG